MITVPAGVSVKLALAAGACAPAQVWQTLPDGTVTMIGTLSNSASQIAAPGEAVYEAYCMMKDLETCKACNAEPSELVVFTDAGLPPEPVEPPEPEPVIDVETKVLCDEDTDTWQCIVSTFTDGELTSEETKDTGIACDEPEPTFEIVRECRDGFINIVTYQIDEDGTQTEVSAVVTAEVCPPDHIQVDFEVVCNEDTNVYDYHTTIVTNGVAADPDVVPTEIPCDQEPPEYKIIRECRDGSVHVVVYEVDEAGATTEISATDTGEPCPPIIKSVDVEFICDTDTNTWIQVTTASTDGVVVGVEEVDTGVPCDEDKPDYELTTICRNDTEHVVVFLLLPGEDPQEVGEIDTGRACTEKTPECFLVQKHAAAGDNNNWVNGISILRRQDSYRARTTLCNGQTFEWDLAAFPNYNQQIVAMGDALIAGIQALDCFAEYSPYCDHHKVCPGTGFPAQPGNGIYFGPDVVFGRYIVISTCDPKKLPVKTEIIDSTNPKAIGAFYEHNPQTGDIRYLRGCLTCGGGEPEFYKWGTNVPVDASTITMECIKPCAAAAEPAPEFPALSCSRVPLVGFDCVYPLDDQGEPDLDAEPTSTPVWATFISCADGSQEIQYSIEDPDNEGEFIEYELQGIFGDENCEPLAPAEEPECEECDKIPVQWRHSAAAWDNSFWPHAAQPWGVLSPNESYDFVSKLANGSLFPFSIPATGSHAAMLAAVGQHFLDAGACIAESYCTNWSNCGKTGLPSPPPELASIFPTTAEAFGRYLHIAHCDPGMLPVETEIVGSSLASAVGSVRQHANGQGPIQYGYKCITCDGTKIFDEDGKELTGSDIPCCCEPRATKLDLSEYESVCVDETKVCHDSGGTTSITASVGGTDNDTIKFNTEGSAADDAKAALQAIKDCVAAGKVSNIELTDPEGNKLTFEVSSLIDAEGQCVVKGKLLTATKPDGSPHDFNVFKVATLCASCGVEKKALTVTVCGPITIANLPTTTCSSFDGLSYENISQIYSGTDTPGGATVPAGKQGFNYGVKLHSYPAGATFFWEISGDQVTWTDFGTLPGNPVNGTDELNQETAAPTGLTAALPDERDLAVFARVTLTLPCGQAVAIFRFSNTYTGKDEGDWWNDTHSPQVELVSLVVDAACTEEALLTKGCLDAKMLAAQQQTNELLQALCDKQDAANNFDTWTGCSNTKREDDDG